MPASLRRGLITFTGLAAVFAVGVGSSIGIRHGWPSLGGGTGDYVASDSLVAGDGLWFVYVGSSQCGWSNQPEVPPAVRAIKSRLARYADSIGLAFKAVGVSLDWDIEAGLTHLRRMGRLDEVSIGDNISNILAVDYFWNEGTAPTSPQVAVFERTLDMTQDSLKPRVLLGGTPRRLASATGVGAILRWAASDDVFPPSSLRIEERTRGDDESTGSNGATPAPRISDGR